MKRCSPDVMVAIVLALLSLAVAAYGGYARNDKGIAERLTGVEVQQRNDAERVQRIEAKLDRLMDWALGK